MDVSRFLSNAGAERYDRYRPKVHAIAKDWLDAATGGRRFKTALDIGCGTGDSMVPLQLVSDSVEGIDLSPAMLAYAARKGWRVRLSSLEDLAEGKYDLLSISMAFHWLDCDLAVPAMHRVSTPGAVWLIYNFGLGRGAADAVFDGWYQRWYLRRFPSPIERPTTFRVRADDDSLVELSRATGSLALELTREELIGFLTTRANVEAALTGGSSYREVEQAIEESLPEVPARGFAYEYTYTIVQRTQ